MVPSVGKAWAQLVMHLGGETKHVAIVWQSLAVSRSHRVNFFEFGKHLSGWKRICERDPPDGKETKCFHWLSTFLSFFQSGNVLRVTVANCTPPWRPGPWPCGPLPHGLGRSCNLCRVMDLDWFNLPQAPRALQKK